MTETLGTRAAHAVAVTDEAALRAVLAVDIHVRGMSPGRTWESTDHLRLL